MISRLDEKLRTSLYSIINSTTVDCSQTREICEKQEKYLKGKVVTFTVQSLILNQYSVHLLTVLQVY